MTIQKTIMHDGKGFAFMTPDQLRKLGVPETTIADAVSELEKTKARDVIRAEITDKAGDLPSLLGTTSDAAALGLIAVLQLVILIAENGTPEMKTALAASAFPMPVAKAKAFLADIKAGKIKVPALLKGTDAVYAEVAKRSTATANVLMPPKA
jgi:hypothetical protein